MGQIVREETLSKEDTPLREETTIPSFNGESDHDTNVVCGLFLKPMNEDEMALMGMFDDIPD